MAFFALEMAIPARYERFCFEPTLQSLMFVLPEPVLAVLASIIIAFHETEEIEQNGTRFSPAAIAGWELGDGSLM